MSRFLIVITLLYSALNFAQHDSLSPNKRLDFAKTYFEFGSSISPSFDGAVFLNGTTYQITNSPSMTSFVNWGGFHFWGHGEFYVSIPLKQYELVKNDSTSFKLAHNVVTGGRFYPWKYTTKKIRPYLGLNWSAQIFQQSTNKKDQPLLSKDFMLVPEIGAVYGFKKFAFRINLNYFHNNLWEYPTSKTLTEQIETPKFNLQIGVLYSIESSHNKNENVNERWNAYPTLSKLNYNDKDGVDFFIAAGPSGSFTLQESTYSKTRTPYLNSQVASKAFIDIATGLQFNQQGIFTALSFRNPKFETSAYGTVQTIKKTSLALELNKFLKDYSGFVPFIGVNAAFNKITFEENVDGEQFRLTENQIEPGITIGWDILPGKTDEALILRTNLRWYPMSSFQVDGLKFDFSQLEYNLIQVVFYPDRLKKKIPQNTH